MVIDAVKQTLQLRPSRDARPAGWAATGAFVIAALLIIWSSSIHFHLWQSLGYRHIATIGPLFLLQSLGGVLLGVLIIGARRVWAAVLGAGFALSTMVGFLISVEYGLFGFKDTWSAPFAHEAFALEIGTIGVCAIAGALCLVGSASSTQDRRTPASLVSTGCAVTLSGAILLAIGGGQGAMSPPRATGGGTLGVSSRPVLSSVHITISNFMFEPMSVTVSPGASVSVSNADSAAHTLTASGGQFDTGDIGQNQTKTFRAPMKPGTYSYICNIHQYMTGTIIVR